MGLDITAYAQIEKLQCDRADECDHERLWVNSDFTAQADGLAGGCYRAAEDFHFRAGSYSGYSVWRDQLAALAGYPATKFAAANPYSANYPFASSAWHMPDETQSLPFYEMINFSDCEGLIGPKTSAKLAADFEAFAARAASHFDEYGMQKYREWMKAFALASNHGAVQFH